MTQRRDPDVLLAAYFTEQTPELPDRVFDAVRRDIHRTRQRLVLAPWQEPDARSLARALPIAATILLVVSLLILYIAAVGPGGGPTASPGPTPNTFRSPFYGYSIVVPTCWRATPATTRWDGESAPSQGANVDQIWGAHLIALGVAGPFTGDLAAFVQDRLTATARDHADTCPPNAFQLSQPITIGGQPGVLLTWNCGALIDQAVTVYGGVGYDFTLRDLAFAATLDQTDLASFRSMLDSLIFQVAPTESP
jgi:hypothetical protein